MPDKAYQLVLGTGLDLAQFVQLLRQLEGPDRVSKAELDRSIAQGVVDPLRAILDIAETVLQAGVSSDVLVSMRLQRVEPLSIVVELT
jgi:hypothetical protein